MTAAAGHEAVFVETAGRLHFGVLDLRGALGRRFGGIGTAAPGPTLLVSARRAPAWEVEGEDAGRAAGFARRFLEYHGLHDRLQLHVHRALPAHVGLGSGTQLALAVARALAEIHGIDANAASLARAVGRAERSAIGTWTFAGGGLVLEGGRSDKRDEVAPLIARLRFPPAWHCVVAVADSGPGLSGAEEAQRLASLPAPDAREVEEVAHLVLMALLPAVADADLATFGSALTRIQRITGRWFASVQGGAFAPGANRALVERMLEWGAAGVGQSSWGPAVYGVVEGARAADDLASRIREALGGRAALFKGPFRTEGARVWRAQAMPAPMRDAASAVQDAGCETG